MAQYRAPFQSDWSISLTGRVLSLHPSAAYVWRPLRRERCTPRRGHARLLNSLTLNRPASPRGHATVAPTHLRERGSPGDAWRAASPRPPLEIPCQCFSGGVREAVCLTDTPRIPITVSCSSLSSPASLRNSDTLHLWMEKDDGTRPQSSSVYVDSGRSLWETGMSHGSWHDTRARAQIVETAALVRTLAGTTYYAHWRVPLNPS